MELGQHWGASLLPLSRRVGGVFACASFGGYGQMRWEQRASVSRVGGSLALSPGDGRAGSRNPRIPLKGLSSNQESFERQGLRRPGADARQKDPARVC